MPDIAKDYELLEHTADIRIRVKGASLAGLFENSALAVFDIIAEKQQLRDPRRHSLKINQKAENIEELFVNWLNELLSLSQARGVIFTGFRIAKLTPVSITAEATGYDMKAYRVNTEVKAATYHQLEIKKTPRGWQAEVVLDV